MNKKYHRRSIRLKGYDYSQEGAYFITIVTENGEHIFGHIKNEKMVVNEYGEVVEQYWKAVNQHFSNVELDEFIVMPNHFHGIIMLFEDEGAGRGAGRCASTKEKFGKPVAGSVPTIVRSFKSAVTKRINELKNTPGAKLWQRNYYEHIIRDEKDMDNTREYIYYNPIKWSWDKENPDRIG